MELSNCGLVSSLFLSLFRKGASRERCVGLQFGEERAMGQLNTTDYTASDQAVVTMKLIPQIKRSFTPGSGATDTTNKEKLHTRPCGDGKGLSLHPSGASIINMKTI